MELTQEYLKSVLHYDPLTGEFIWIANRIGPRKAGNMAGGFCKTHGYRFIRLDGILHRGHRLAFLYMTGQMPSGEVDHINHCRHDNRWANLRETNKSGNMKNTPVRKSNTSGHVGVSWYKRIGKWTAQISSNNKHINLGFFENIEDAIAARKAASIKYGFHPNHGHNSHQNAKPIRNGKIDSTAR